MSKILLKYFVVKVTVRDNAIENCPQAKGKPLTVVMDIHTYPFGPLHLVPIYYLVSRSICKCLGRVFLFFCFFFFLCFCILIELQGRSCWQSEGKGIEFSIDGKTVPGRVCFCGVGGVRGVLQVSAINL